MRKVRNGLNDVLGVFALGFVGAYRVLVSPLLLALFGPGCRFAPTCSAYAQQAISEHGAWRGGYLAARRLLRCHPLGGYGYDPVPPRARAVHRF